MKDGLLLAALAALLWIFYREYGVSGSAKNTGIGGGVYDTAARAIYDFEDPKKTAIATRQNNPGNLKFARQKNAVPGDRGFAKFPSIEAGFEALKKQLALNVRRRPNETLAQMFSRYLGGDGSAVKNQEGDSQRYAEFVARRLGTSKEKTLAEIFGSKG